MNLISGFRKMQLERAYNSIFKVLILFFIFSLNSHGQNYPVDINVLVLPPHAPSYHTFSQSSMMQSNKMQVTMTLKDLVVDQLDIGLQVEFRGESGSFVSDPALISQPFTLIKGMPKIIQNQDLAPYFLSNGLSEAVVSNGGFLPEGQWEICVTAFELLNQEQVSQQTCYYMFLEEMDPPEIIMPLDSMLPTYPQNIQLSWQPLHIGSFPVRYMVNVWEAIDGFTDQQIVESTQPYISKNLKQQTTDWLSVADPPMVVGQEYIMQVLIEDDINGMMGPQVYAFKNNGFSEIHRFKYGMHVAGEECETPSTPEYMIDDSLRYFVYWDGGEPPAYQYEPFSTFSDASTMDASSSSSFGGIGIPGKENQGGGGGSIGSASTSSSSGFSGYYKMYYRIEGTEDWSSIETKEAWAEFDDYQRGYTYEIYVTKVCSAEERASESIFIDIPSLPVARDFECGLPLLPVDLENQVPLAMLNIGDTIMASDFRVSIREVSGSDGYFTGKGAFQTGFFGAAVEVEFTDIFVNSEYRMVEGFIQTTWDPEGSFMFNLDSLFSSFNNGGEPQFPKVEVEYLDSVKIVNGVVVIYPDGDTYDMPIYITSPQGNYLGIAGMVLPQTDPPKPTSISEDYQVIFETQTNYNYGFDNVDLNFEKYYVKFNGEAIPHKSVAMEGRDKIDARISVSATNWKASDWDSVKVITADGFELMYDRKSGDSKAIEIWVPGLDKDQNIYVMYGEECMGVFNLQVYEFTNLTVNLIPVNGAGQDVNEAEIQSKLNKILGQGVFGVEVNLLKEEGIQSDVEEISAEKYLLSQYRDDMKSILQDHKDKFGQDRNEMYLFLHPNLKDNVVGYMPIKYNAGFIEVNDNTEQEQLIKTIAHELGHGALTLEHYFEGREHEEGNSTNLMDYGSGTDLNFFQWSQMHSRKGLKTWFQGSEDAQYVSLELGDLFKDFIVEDHLSFLSNTGKTVSIKADAIQRMTFATGGEAFLESGKQIPIGTLTFFTLKEDSTFVTYANYGNGNYYVYPKVETNIPYQFEMPATVNPVILRPTFQNGKEAIHIVGIENTAISEDNYPFDFLINHFYDINDANNEYKLKGKVVTFDEIGSVQLGAEFSSDLYQSLVNNHKNFAEASQISSFYLNGLAYFIDKNYNHFKLCDPSAGIESIFESVLLNVNKNISTLNIMYKGLIEGLQQLNGLEDLLHHFQNHQVDEITGLNKIDLIKITLARSDLIATYQQIIDKNTDLSIIKAVLKDALFDLQECEFEQLYFSYPVIEELISFMILDDHFWLNNKEEKIIIKLLNKIDPLYYNDFIQYLEETTASIIVNEYGTSYQEISNTNKTLWLWEQLIHRIDNSVFDKNGEKFVLELTRIWNQTNSINERLEQNASEFITNVDQLISSGNSEINSALFKALCSKIVPFYYEGFLNRVNWVFVFMNQPHLAFPLTPITNVSLNDDGTFNAVVQNKVVFYKDNIDENQSFYNLKPFEPIFIDQKSKFGTATDLIGENDLKAYPAFTLYYLNENAEKRTQSDLFFTALDAASLAIPATTIIKIGWLGRGLVYADKISSITGITATYYQDQNRDVAKILNATSAILGLSNLGAEGFAKLSKIGKQELPISEIFSFVKAREIDNLENSALKVERLEELFDRISTAKFSEIELLSDAEKATIVKIIEFESNEIAKLGSNLNNQKRSAAIARLGGTITDLSNDAIDLSNSAIKAKVVSTLEESNNFEKLGASFYQDVIVHSTGSKFIVDGIEHNAQELANILSGNAGPIRLLSCNDLASAQELSAYLGREVIANGGLTRIHIDGHISVVSKNGSGTDWFRVMPSGDMDLHIVSETATQYADDFVEMGSAPILKGFSAICPAGFITRFDRLGFGIDEVKVLFTRLDDDVLKVEKFLDNLENYKDLEDFVKFVDDLKKLDAIQLVRRISNVEKGEVGGIVKSWRVARNLPDEIRLNPD
ncbi:hypothetical protein, partial [Portibacter lacus]